LIELLTLIGKMVLTSLYTLCQWAAAQKVIILLYRKLQNLLWQKDTDLPLDSTLHYSETPGELNKIVEEIPRGIYTEEQFNNLRKDL
jgi:hypothetical protein